jgi:hypothetical protein
MENLAVRSENCLTLLTIFLKESFKTSHYKIHT